MAKKIHKKDSFDKTLFVVHEMRVVMEIVLLFCFAAILCLMPLMAHGAEIPLSQNSSHTLSSISSGQ